MTSVRHFGFNGWPYSYFGQQGNVRAAPARPDLVQSPLVLDHPLGAHTGSLGLTFHTGALFEAALKNGAFAGLHGSWNRDAPSGNKVIFVPFVDSVPAGDPQDILAGIVNEGGEAMGRPVGLGIDATRALLNADDVGNKVWRLVPDGPTVLGANP